MEEEMESDEDVYEVEKIVDNVVVGGKTYYRVRWQNYAEDGDTWEPRENLLSCEDLLNNYIRMQTEKSTGLVLPSDVFTAGTGDDSGSESGIKGKKKVKKEPETKKKGQKKQRKEKPKKTPRVIDDTSSESSDDEPQVKDDFWERLKDGKIDVFASDLYSKVKQRRPPEKEVDEMQQDLPPEITGKTKKRGPRKKSRDDDEEIEKEESNEASTKSIKKKEKGEKKSKSVAKQRESDEDIMKVTAKDDSGSEEIDTKNEDHGKPRSRVKKSKSVAKQRESDEDIMKVTVKDDSGSEEIDTKNEDQGKPRSRVDNQEQGASESNVVLQYLRGEREGKKPKKKQKSKKDKDGKDAKNEQKESKKSDSSSSGKKDFGKAEKRTLTINLDDPDFERKTKEEIKKGSLEERKEEDPIKHISEPSIILEKLDLKESEGKRTELPKLQDKSLNEAERTKEKKKKKKKKIRDEDISETEKIEESDRADVKNDTKSTKDAKAVKEKGAFDIVDAFSAQLRESDHAVSDLMMRKKEKVKKHKQTPKVSTTERQTSSSPSSTAMGASVLEMLTQEMERTVSMTSDPKMNATYESALQDVHSKFGLEAPKLSSITVESEKLEKARCSPEMTEFLKIKVNFELDEISLKDIERHHEMGEPPCRLEKDITNAEFRGFIRSNNFEMVHEALKSKKMMYNLEHTDTHWNTQLMTAASDGFDEIVKILSHHGAKVNARSKNGSTALMIAAEKGRDVVCRILIAYGAYINLINTNGETALMRAARNGHTMIVRYLLQAGGDPSIKSSNGMTALEIAEKGSQPPLTSLMKDHETNINAHVNECIHRECHSLGIKTIGLPILAPRLYNIRETPLVHITFNCVLQNILPSTGIMLFVVHGMIGSGLSIKCRMRGPCFVQAVTLNNYVMEPMMPGKQASDENTHFITNLIWKTGQNSLRLFVSQDALSSEKLFVCAFQCGFDD